MTATFVDVSGCWPHHKDQELSSLWQGFRKERQVLTDSTNAAAARQFSLILDAMGQNITNVYQEFKFSDAHFQQLDLLLLKVEDMCLFSLIYEFERFRLRQEQETTQKSTKADARNEDIFLENRKSIENKDGLLKRENDKAKTARKKTLRVKNEPDLAELSHLGRGKRKKFAKVQYDMVDNSDSESALISPNPRKLHANISDNTCGNNEPAVGLPIKENTCNGIGKSGPFVKLEEFCPAKSLNNLTEDLSKRINPSHDNIGEADSSTQLDSVCAPVMVEQLNTYKTPTDMLSAEKVPKSIMLNKQSSVNNCDKMHTVGERTDFQCDDAAPIICSICKEKVKKGRDLLKHFKEVHKDENNRSKTESSTPNLFYCETCHESFPASRRFKLHYRIHSGARPHSCKVCSKSFRTFKGLLDHMACHSTERPFSCPQCPKAFISKKLLNKHIKAHNNEITPRVCELCGKQYQSALGLKLHYRVHAGLRPHKCDVCGMAFTQRCSLQIHKRLHTGDKRHVCDICGWRFVTNTALVTHRRVHTGEKPYKCSQCPFQASSSSCLKDHQIVHTKEKPYQCKAPGCNKHFKRQAHLISHLKKKHSGLKPYQCTLCGSKFAMVSELTQHQKRDACQGGRIKKEPSPGPVAAPHPEIPSQSVIRVSTSDKQHRTVILEGAPGWHLQDGGQRPQILEGAPGWHVQQDGGQRPQILEGAPGWHLQQDGAQRPQPQIVTTSSSDVQADVEDQIVIHIVTESGTDGSDIVLSEEEMAAIVRLSQQI